MNCPKCNAEIPAGKNFCVECGEHLPEQPQARKCAKCGAAIPNGKNFCVECGEHLPEQPQVRKCAKCGSVIPDGKNFCIECGERLPEEKTPSKPEPRKCAKCGSVIPDGKNFCIECGEPYAAKMTAQAPTGGMKNAGTAAPDGTAAASPAPILSGSKWSYIVMGIAGAALLINLIGFLISEFWLPEFKGAMIVGLFVALIPPFAVSICMMSVRTKDGRFVPIMKLSALSKVVLYAGCGLAVIINFFGFCWTSELQNKYSLYCFLHKTADADFDPSFQWRKDISRKADRTYVVKNGEALVTYQYKDTSAGREWKCIEVTINVPDDMANEFRRMKEAIYSGPSDEEIIQSFEKPDLD